MNSIFISSSFMDMQHERDAIRYLVLPKINDYLRKNYGQETTIIDLRWGIDTSNDDEASSMKKIIRTCLFEIDNCKPFMIALLGDRYGTLISKEQCTKYLPEAGTLIQGDTIGVTELEIRYAMHLAKQDKMHILFYFRDMDYSSVPPNEKESKYFDKFDPEEKSEKLAALKCDIHSLFPEACRSYPASWDISTSQLSGIDHFVDMVVEDMLNCIADELGTPQKGEIAIDDAFSKSRQISFIGREKELSEIEKFLNSTNSNIAFLTGDEGTGKSAVMANIPNKLGSPFRTFVSVYCGQGDFSDTAQGIMRTIVYRLNQLMGRDFTFNDAQKNQTTSQWHSMMDGTIQKHLETHHKELVILIDGIDQMVQDSDTKKMLFLPYNHGGKVKVLLSAVTGYQVETSLPTLENASWITMEKPSRGDIEKVIDEVWLKYGKPSVSRIIKKKIEEKPLSNNFLYVNIVLSRLTFLGVEVFGDSKNSEQHIVENIIRIVDEYPDTLAEAANELLSVLGNKINPSLASEVFSFLQLSENGLRLPDIQFLCKDTFDASDFSCIKMLLGAFMFERSDHRLDFSHRVFRNYINSPSKKLLYSRYFQLAESLPVEDNLSISYRIHSAVLSEKYDVIFEMIRKWHDNPTVALKLGEQLAHSIKISGGVVAGLIENIPSDITSKGYMSFISNCLLPFLPVSKETKKLIDGISDACVRKQNGTTDCGNDVPDLTNDELEAYKTFEKKRFDLHFNYSGGSKCETNRYYKTLLEYARRESTIERRLLVADFELDYNAYWNANTETYDFRTYLNPLFPDASEFRERIALRQSSIVNKIISEFEEEIDPGALLVLAKAYINKADAQYPLVIIKRNEVAEASITEALNLLDKVVSNIGKLPYDSRNQYRKTVAKCYQMISDIYLRASREHGFFSETGIRGLELALLRTEFYKQAHTYYKYARTLCLTKKEWLEDDGTLDSLMDVFYGECVIITDWDYLEISEKLKIEEELSELIKHVERNMYLVIESQSLCSKYALLCSLYADYLSNGIPFVEHVSERKLYPWSTVETKEENYRIYHILEDMDYWCNRSLFLYKSLYSLNPSPGNVGIYIQALRNRLKVLMCYSYRSKETIDNAIEETRHGYTRIVVSDKQIKKDAQQQRKRQFPILIELCNVLRTPECLNNELTRGLFILAAMNAIWMCPYFSNDTYLDDFKAELKVMESSFLSVIEQSITDPKSFGYYLLIYRLSYMDFDRFIYSSDTERVDRIKEEYEKAKEQSDWRNRDHPYARYADEWEFLS